MFAASRHTPVTGRMSIAAAERAFGLTARAIRFYDSRGLVRLARDSRNVRVLDQAACARLQMIAQFRRAGLSIADIDQLLSMAGDTDRMQAVALEKLQEQRDDLRARLQRVERTLDALSAAA